MQQKHEFEKAVEHILQEAPEAVAGTLNTAQQALLKVTGNDYLWKGPGLASNKYSSDKRYYPNIRASFMGWRNISTDKASSKLIAELKKLDQIKTWSPQWSPESQQIRGVSAKKIVSNNYSSEFVPNAEKDMQKALDDLKRNYIDRIPMNTDMQNELNEMINRLASMSKEDDPTAYKNLEKDKNDLLAKLQARMESGVGQGAQRKYEDAKARFGEDDPRTKDLKRAANEERTALNKNISSSFNDPYGVPGTEAPARTTGAEEEEASMASGKAIESMGAKAAKLAQTATNISGRREKYTYEMGEIQQQHVNMIRNEFEKVFQKFEEIMSARMSLEGDAGDGSVPGAANDMIDPPDTRLGTSVLRGGDNPEDVTIYRDSWGQFIGNIQNSIIGKAQRGWSAGADLPTILTGDITSEHRRPKGGARIKSITSIDPKTLETIHNNVMTPLFLSKDAPLIYVTPEQWESISQGGRLKKGALGFAAQAYDAGKKRPAVKL